MTAMKADSDGWRKAEAKEIANHATVAGKCKEDGGGRVLRVCGRQVVVSECMWWASAQ